MNAKLLAYSQIKALPLPSQKGSKRAIRRIFDNSQIIEKFDKWLMICGKAKNTRDSYTLAVKQFAKFLLDKPLTAATKQDVRGFVTHLYMKQFAATTIQVRLDALRVFFDCLQLGGQVRVSVPRFILRRKLPKHLPQVLSEEQVNKLIAATRTPRDRAILELGYASGLRVNELANLRVEDVNIRARSLIVRQGKGGDDRIALFGRPAAAALREYLEDRRVGPLFVAEPRVQRGGVTRGVGLTARSIFRIVVQAAKRAGLTGVHPHILRHSCATHCLNRGMDIRFVQEMLGHTSLMATQKYLHLAIANLQAVHAKFFPRG